MMTSDGPLSDFGEGQIRRIGTERTGREEKPSGLRYIVTLLIKVSGELAGLMFLVLFLAVLAFVVFDGLQQPWGRIGIRFLGLYVYAQVADRVARKLGYEDWWGLGGAA